eukprot:scaffold171638_cov37-Tisochrysis_lutea.AAC.1
MVDQRTLPPSAVAAATSCCRRSSSDAFHICFFHVVGVAHCEASEARPPSSEKAESGLKGVGSSEGAPAVDGGGAASWA